MLDGSIELDWLAGPLVEALVENRFDAAVAVGAGRKCSAGGRHQAVLAVAVGQAQAPQAGTERRLGVASGTKHVGAQLGGVRSDGCGPADEALRRPLTHRPVLLGHGLIGGGMAVFERGAYVAGDALAAVDALHGGGGEPHVELASDQGVGDGVVVALHLDVVVDVDPRLLPLGEHVGRGGKGAKRRALDLLEQRAPRARELAERAFVEPLEELRGRGVELDHQRRRCGGVARPGSTSRPLARPPRPWPCHAAFSPASAARRCRNGRPDRGRWGGYRARSDAPGSPPSADCRG